ncbi:MAG: flagellar hook-basal body complex protein, partial [Synergistaceae bacterium]|nr:flagellar hook-basal body complex protein [Synergistaceae bacterium]
MLRSLYAAVSGVKAHQTYLDVTGNNIANVNTVGFKRDTVQFRDMIYQTMKNPSAPDNGVPIGGVNPGQVGLGVSVGAIETIYTEGSMQSTGVNTDMMITGGAGFFVVDSGNGILYTRAGNFELDADGNLTMAGLGYKVQGYAYKNQIDPVSGELTRVRDSTMGDIVIKAKEKIPAKATTLVAFRSNLCSTAEKEIADLSGIPGGPNAVCRPQEYTSYEVKAATYVGTNVPPSGAAGQTWFNGEYVYKYDAGAWVWDSDTLMYSSDIYWGQNTDTDPPFETISRGVNEDNGIPTNIGALAENGVDKIDIRGLFVPTNDTTAPPPPWPYIPTDGPSYEPDPAKAVPPISKAGQTYIDETTGLIYTTNSAGTMWDLDSPTPYDTKKAYYVGSSYDSATGFTPDEKTYIQRPGTLTWSDMVQVDNVLTVSSDGKARVIAWNKSCGAFTDINLANGLCPSDGAIATQESITAFGQ